MTEPKTKYPIESFGPQLMAALKRGGRERIVIPFPGPTGKRTAHNFQRRINTLRQRMRQEKHPDYMIATRAKVSIFWGEKAQIEGGDAYKEWSEDHNGHRGAIIVIQPRDSEFEHILSEAGFPTPTVAVPVSTAHEHPPRDDLDDLLDELSGAKP